MKACVIQPPYSRDLSRSDELFAWKMNQLRQCDESMDLIVLPEYSDALADVKSRDGFYQMVDTYNEKLLTKAAETAKRCHALMFVNAAYRTENGIRNTTHAIDREADRSFLG